MKKLMVALTAMILSLTAYSQVSQSVATLYHEGELSSYYGMNALIDAYNAAAEGDIITLSSGSFKSCNIDKSITIRGAGCDRDSIYNGMPTYLLGDFSLSGVDTNFPIINIEGIYTNHTVTFHRYINASFNRCRLNIVNCYNTSGHKITTFINCRICGSCSLDYGGKSEFYNCLVTKFYNNGDPCSIYNSILYLYAVSAGTFVTNSIILNCVYGSGFDKANCALTNNVGFGENNIFNGYGDSNKLLASDKMQEVFETFSADCSDDTSTYHLKNKEGFTITTAEGTDEIGIHGGLQPWGTVPHNPQITKFQVDKKSSATGKLNVTIEVGN